MTLVFYFLDVLLILDDLIGFQCALLTAASHFQSFR